MAPHDYAALRAASTLISHLWRLLVVIVQFWSGPASLIEREAEAPSAAHTTPDPVAPEDGLPPESFLAHTASSFSKAVSSRLGRGDGLARALYKAYFRDRNAQSRPPAEICASAGLGGKVLGLAEFVPPLSFAKEPIAPPPAGETEKYVLRCVSHEEVEMVVMPAPGAEGSWSLCVSSQVGCRMGCAFCETGKMGLLRNLDVGEIVSQVFHARVTLQLRVANVVFMGMGEPLDNVDNVIAAIRVLTDALGLNIPMSHVTVSTSGEAAAVYKLQESLPSVRLAFSLHAANDTLRSRLMPINRRVPLAELGRAMASYISRSKKRVMIQYVLLAGINDAVDHAEELVAFLATTGPSSRLCVNLIPYNPQSRPAFTAPTHDACKAFKTALQAAGLFVKIREEKGQRKMAACGQLGNVRLRRDLSQRKREEDERLQTEACAGGEDLETAAEAAAEAASVMQQHALDAVPSPRAEPSGCLCAKDDLSW